MTKLVVKTGMKNEYDIVKAHAGSDVTILTGVQTVSDLEAHVPSQCQAILSFGMSGGLRTHLPVVGQTVIASHLVDPEGHVYQPTQTWRKRLFQATHAYVQPYYSSGLYNTANTPKERLALYDKYQAWCIDDESLAVAQFALKHKLAWNIVRNVSDAWNDNVNITAGLLNSTGNVDIWNVIKAFATDPEDMIKIWRNYNLSNAELGVAAVQLGPTFQWVDQ